MPCLFVGIDFPQELKLALSKLGAGYRAGQTCKFHLTLRFIGTVDDPTAADITAVLLQIDAPSFLLWLAAGRAPATRSSPPGP